MKHPVTGIDHCFALVHDLDAAAAQYSALGFTLSPRGLHSKAKGSANYTIMFPEDYFELLGLLHPTDANAPRRAMLAAAGEGLHAIACRIDTAEGAVTALADLGIDTYGLGSFERPVPLPGGGEGIAAFSTASFAPSEVPHGIVFMCQHKTRETVWIPDLLDHPNSACGLAAILSLSDDPAREAAGFARLWADGSVEQETAGATVHTGRNSAPLRLRTKAQMQTDYPGIDLDGTAKGAFAVLQIKVRDMEAARVCLEKNGVAAFPSVAGLAVAPKDAAGVVVEFVSA